MRQLHLSLNYIWVIAMELKLISLLVISGITFSACDSAIQKAPAPSIDTIESIQPIVGARHFISGYAPKVDNDIQVVIEIPTGTTAKWEVDKSDGLLHWEIKNGNPRIVEYLGYPGNYGMIPRTLLAKDSGGDGDPLDVIVLGPPVDRGSVVKAKLIGVLKLLDGGEQDDKLIAVLEDTSFYFLNSINDLDENFSGVSLILSTWFESYKGPGEMQAKGFGEITEAEAILDTAILAFESSSNE